MKLKEFLDFADLSVPQFAGMVGAPPSTVYRWIADGATMTGRTMALVYAFTGGLVGPFDYFPEAAAAADLPGAKAAREAVKVAMTAEPKSPKRRLKK